MSTATMDTEELARIALGGRALKNRRVRRAIIARLINENGESELSEEDESEEETGEEGGEDRDLLRALVASRALKRRRFRRALLAHLLRARSESEGEEGEEETGDDGGEDRELVRALIASRMLRRRRVRRTLLVHLLRSKAEGMNESDEGEEDVGDEG